MKDNPIYSSLLKWTEVYIESKDAIKKKIISIEKDKDFDLIIKHKDKEEFYIIDPFIKDINSIINKLDKEKIITLVVFNSKKNFDFIVENWKRFIDFKDFKIIFVNLFSETDKKWIINPYIHQRICDESSLKTGLKSMFNTVVSTNEEKIKQSVKNQKEFI